MRGAPFYWGAGTSPYQCEGGYNGPGQPQNNWSRLESGGRVELSGRAADFWHRYAEDFRRCRRIGLNAVRMGVEWARVQPVRQPWARFHPGGEVDERGERPVGDSVAGAEPAWDSTALDHYAGMLRTAREEGLEPFVTLHHFTHPAWIGADPWLEPGTPALFARYARRVVEELNNRLGRPLAWLLTLNEPNMLVLNTYLFRQFPSGAGRGLGRALEGWMQILRAHVLAYNALHDLYQERGWPRPRVGINTYCSDLYWGDRLQFDLLTARESGILGPGLGEHLRLRASQFERDLGGLAVHRDLAGLVGEFVRRRLHRAADRWMGPGVFEPLLEELRCAPRSGCLDYVGLDYYDPFFAHAFRWPAWGESEVRHLPFRDRLLATVTRRWWDWRVLPRGLSFFCRQMAGYGHPVWIAENGMALRRPQLGGRPAPRRDRLSRSQFLELHLGEVRALRAGGVPLAGYIHWALFDNYEWGTYSPRFGLFSVNFNAGGIREEEEPGGDRPAEAYGRWIREVEEDLEGGL